MPIRFRCPVCDGLLSIAKRKAGQQVQCPKCGDEVTVPDADVASGEYDLSDDAYSAEPDGGEPVAVAAGSPAATAAAGASPLFDRIDIDKLLDPAPAPPPQLVTTPLPAAATKHPADHAEDGIHVSRLTLVVAGLLVFVLLALSFATGLLIGH